MRTVVRVPIALVAALLALTACTPKEVAPEEVTKAEVRRLKPLMTYQEVAAVVGGPGQVIKPGEKILGAIIPTSDGQTVYLWRNKDGSLLSAAFNEDRLTGWSEHDF